MLHREIELICAGIHTGKCIRLVVFTRIAGTLKTGSGRYWR